MNLSVEYRLSVECVKCEVLLHHKTQHPIRLQYANYKGQITGLYLIICFSQFQVQCHQYIKTHNGLSGNGRGHIFKFAYLFQFFVIIESADMPALLTRKS